MKIKKRRSTVHNIVTVLAIGILLALLIGGVAYYRRSAVVPKDISSQVNFPIFYPQPGRQILVNEASFKYDKSLQQVSFTVEYNGSNITFAEQSSPDSFSADPSFYPAFVAKLNSYANFESINGRVDLAQPTETKDQTAIMNAKGTLTFANANKGSKLSENSWKRLFNSVENTRP
jgi:hypothetical protein